MENSVINSKIAKSNYWPLIGNCKLEIGNSYQKRLGFTLMELMIVIALVGLISTIAFGSYQKAQKRSRDSRRKADLTQIQKAMEQCYSLISSYPEISDLGSAVSISCGGEEIMSSVPSDPRGGNCVYHGSSTTDSYLFWTDLEMAANGCNSSRDDDDFSVSNLQ